MVLEVFLCLQAIDPAGRSCRDIVYGSDLIGVVGQANQSIELLWGESHCQCMDYHVVLDWRLLSCRVHMFGFGGSQNSAVLKTR